MHGRFSRAACRWGIAVSLDTTPWLNMREIEEASMTGRKELHPE